MMRSRNSAVALYVVITAVLAGVPASVRAQSPELRRTCRLPFSGQASGGTLILADTLNRNARFIAVETSAGESAESVAQRLADAINEQGPFQWHAPAGAAIVSASGNTLTDLLGSCTTFFLAGSETGLGIPGSPTSLTCNYRSDSNRVLLSWRNPAGGYDSLRLVLNWSNYDRRAEIEVAGALENYVVDLSKYSEKAVEDLDIWLVGVRNSLPSSAAAMHVRKNTQEELFGIPFVGSAAPNWTTWSLDGKDSERTGQSNGKSRAASAQRKALTNTLANKFRFNPVDNANAKPFVQSMQGGDTAGATRTFLGLSPGNKYRITTRVGALKAPAANSKWSLSFYAVPLEADRKELSPGQMAGSEQISTKLRGTAPTAPVAQFDERNPFKRRFEEVTREIVLPEGSTSIAVWFRFQSEASADEVVSDYIALEDLGAP